MNIFKEADATQKMKHSFWKLIEEAKRTAVGANNDK